MSAYSSPSPLRPVAQVKASPNLTGDPLRPLHSHSLLECLQLCAGRSRLPSGASSSVSHRLCGKACWALVVGAWWMAPAYMCVFPTNVQTYATACLIPALLGYGLRLFLLLLPSVFVNQSISFFRQCFYMKTKRNKKQPYF